MVFHLLRAIVLCLTITSPTFSFQSTITEAEGNACMGDDKSRKQTEQSALIEAKKKAIEFTSTYVKSEAHVKNFQLEKDLLSAYANAEVKIIQELKKVWYKDATAGDCFSITIKAEVVPDSRAMAMLSDKARSSDDPSAPLLVNVWTEKKEYKAGEKIRIYLKGNKPFYARVIYKDTEGRLLQLLPNPYRADNYFNGGALYEIPTGNDKFDLEVSPPFGEENVIVYAGTTPLGDIDVQTKGGVYVVKSATRDIGVKTRGIKLMETDGKSRPSEFSETSTMVKTGQ
jgi:hypothetical protein